VRRQYWRSMEIEAQSAFGARFVGRFPDLIHTYLYFFGVWEPNIAAFYRRTLRPGDVVVDVGANVGVHALLAGHLVGPAGRVHAIEASPTIFDQLQRNIDANRATNIEAYHLAVMDRPGEVEVFLYGATNRGGTTVVQTVAADRGAAREAIVEGRPLGAIVPAADLRRARLIKIDVEGAEWFVAQGMREFLPELDPDAQVLMEVNNSALRACGTSLDALIGLFTEAGFEPWEIDNPYTLEPYISKPDGMPVPLRRRDFEQADLVFRKTGATMIKPDQIPPSDPA
jgi:FkbM family methyltransferase